MFKIGINTNFLKISSSLIPKCLNFHRVADLKDSGKKITLKGWVTSVRKMKDTIFFDLNDGSCPSPLQVVVQKTEAMKSLQFGCSVEAKGDLVVNKNENYEMKADQVTVLGKCEEGYPFAPRKQYTTDYLRQFLHLRMRDKSFSSLSRIRSSASRAFHQFFEKEGFINIHTPLLTSNDCEGAGEVFTVETDQEKGDKKPFFDDKTFLTVSGQLHLEVAARCLNQVYTFGPTFRAENSKSRLHLSEFYMLEGETALARNTDDLVHFVTTMFQFVTKYLFENCADDVYLVRKNIGEKAFLEKGDLEKTIDRSFNVMSYDEVANILRKQNLKTKFSENSSLTKEQELFLVEYNGNEPLFVVDWPAATKPFYMKSISNSDKVMAFDLLCPNVGEVCGGSMREDDYSKLEEKLKTLNLTDKLNWYLELRQFGNVLTGGFGLGFERYIQVLLNILNIKDAILFPRWPHNCKM